MRSEIRLNNLLLLSVNPANLISIDKVLLDRDLSNIKYNAAENYENYKKNYCATTSCGCNIKVPMFITPKEREEHK